MSIFSDIYCLNGVFYNGKHRGLLRFVSVFAAVLFIAGIFYPASIDAFGADDLDKLSINKGEPQYVHSVGYSSVLYNNVNGLPTSEANTIVQSADGFIWIGGYSGLIRYNGNEFYRYPSSTGISSVVCLFVDSKGRLWIGTNDSGVALMKEDSFRFYSKKDGLNSYSIRAITEDDNGNILLATTMGMAYIDIAEKLHVIDEPQLNKEYIADLDVGVDGVAYGVTLGGAFFTLESKRVKDFYSAKDMGYGTIHSVSADKENRGFVYLGSEDGHIIHCNTEDIKKSKQESLTVRSTEPHQVVNDIRIIKGKMWVCTDNGIGFFDEKNEYNILDDAPMTGSVNHIMSDHEGNLWFTSDRQGVMKIVQNNFIDISSMAGLDPLVVNSTCKRGNLLYVATDTGLKILDEKYDLVENNLTKFVQGVRIRCIKEDRNKNLWFCTYSDHALIRYDQETGKIKEFTTEDGMLSNRVRMIKELSDGRIAVATNAGINIIKGDNVTDHYDSKSGINNLEILSIEEDSGGRLLAGSDGDGIYIIDKGITSRLGISDGLTSEVILRVKKDPDNELFWIVTSNSIAYLKDGSVTTVKNFPYSNNFDVFFDKNGFLWVLSSNGIYVVKKQEMIDNKEIDFTLYDTKCGLPCAATANSYSDLLENGELYISGSSGVSMVNIDQDMTSGSDVLLDISYMMVDDTYVECAPNSFVRLPSTCKRLNIFPNAFTYALNTPRLSYYLENFDDEPIEVTKEGLSSATYTNLGGGIYRFHLSTLDPVTGNPDKTVIVTIIKERAFYEMTWFWILAIFAFAALVVLILVIYYNNKTKQLLQKEAENKKLINEMTSAFAKCVDSKDAYTNGHSFRVASYAAMLAKRLGKSREEIDTIYRIALLHDIGKISIPDRILNKPGRLNDEEYKIMKSHSIRGYEILKDITIAPELALGAACHHEKIDGSGYPAGLKGSEIPEVAQIIAVADTFDAMYSTRPYRKKMELGDAMKEIKKGSGTHFNPKIVEVFIALAKEGAFDKIPETPERIEMYLDIRGEEQT